MTEKEWTKLGFAIDNDYVSGVHCRRKVTQHVDIKVLGTNELDCDLPQDNGPFTFIADWEPNVTKDAVDNDATMIELNGIGPSGKVEDDILLNVLAAIECTAEERSRSLQTA